MLKQWAEFRIISSLLLPPARSAEKKSGVPMDQCAAGEHIYVKWATRGTQVVQVFISAAKLDVSFFLPVNIERCATHHDG